MIRLSRFIRRFAAGVLVAMPGARASFFGPPKEIDVTVVVDLTADGRKMAQPSREHPAYYFPVVAGYKESGSIVAGEKKPPDAPVARLLAKALAAQGYLVVGPKTPAPSFIFVFHWGYLNPTIDEIALGNPEDLPQQIFWNEKEMLGLVAGHTLGNLPSLGSEREDVLHAAREDRYFVIVSAFDFAAAKEKKKKLLWVAKMSTPSNRVDLADVLPALIASGGPHFGRETDRPKSVTAPLAREGQVDVGTPTVVDEAKPNNPTPNSAQKK